MRSPRAEAGALLADALDRSRLDERRRALRALLMQPLLSAGHPAYPLVRRHAEWLRRWLQSETGWQLQVEGDFARLHKRCADHSDGTRPGGSDYPAAAVPFSRRRYALLCLALAVLERGEVQTALGRLGQHLVAEAGEPALQEAGLRFELDNREERRDLVAVVRLLLALGVLRRVAGDEEAFVSAGGDALYDVNRRVLASLLVTSRGPSLTAINAEGQGATTKRMAAVTETFVPETAEGRNRHLRQSLTRRLLDDPVVYWSDLQEDERAYLTSQRAAICGRIQEATGMVEEVRTEGIAMVDATGDLTDCRMPSEGTEGHATLLLATWLAERAADRTGAIPLEELEEQMRGWIVTFGRHWRQAAREKGAEKELCRQALRSLTALRLAKKTPSGILPLPAIGRYALGETRLPSDTATLELDS